MDTTCQDISFNIEGRCNYCLEFEDKLKKIKKKKKNDLELSKLIQKIKIHRENNKNKYDCVVGLSGGIDSSYTLLKVVESGLKPLVVHMDNGWNSELAQNNIERLIKSLNVDFYTHVVRWSEYRNLMQSFFDADVIDVELLTDNAMLAINYQIAKDENIPFILSGTNASTEGMKMPKNMNWFKYDKKHIVSINKKFKNQKIVTYPIIGIFELIYFILIKKIKWVNFLDYFNYDKKKAEQELEIKYGFKRYKYKHYESVFTRFYQGYLLPKKFKIDKRILHLSTLIVTKQISREDALKEISKSPYPNEIEMKEDIEYFLKKMNWTEDDLNNYINRKPKSHYSYPNNRIIFEFLLKNYKKINL